MKPPGPGSILALMFEGGESSQKIFYERRIYRPRLKVVGGRKPSCGVDGGED
jgi:hypothetical protein